MDMALDPSKPLQPDDMLFIIGKNSDLERFKLK
jgi:K+/H+ antiporter YhaU regulatory subunit KhtT